MPPPGLFAGSQSDCVCGRLLAVACHRLAVCNMMTVCVCQRMDSVW